MVAGAVGGRASRRLAVAERRDESRRGRQECLRHNAYASPGWDRQSALKLTPASSMPAAGSSAALPWRGSAAGWKLNQRASASSLAMRRLMMIRLRRKALRKPLATCQKATSDRGSARMQPATTRRSRAVMGSQKRR